MPDETANADLDSVVRELAPRLLRFAVAATGDRNLAEDATQDALVALVRRWRSSGPPDSPEAFAFAIARRRGRRARWKQTLHRLFRESENGRSAPARLDEEIAGRQQLASTLAAMDRLSPSDREALALVVLGEVGLAEGAGLLGISRSALKMRIHRARKRLRALLEVDDDEQ